MRSSDVVAFVSRIVSGIALMLIVGALPWLSARDPAESILRARYAELEPTPEALEAIRVELGLADGPVVMSARWWGGVLRGDLGNSWVSGHPVTDGIVQALGVSATLTGLALLVAVVVSLLLVGPTMRRVAQGRPASGAGAAGAALTALPEFLLASALLVIFAVQIPLFPPSGWTGFRSAALPALALGLPAGGLFGRLLADAIAGASTERWVGVWRAAGAPSAVLTRAVLRRAAAAVVAALGLIVLGLLGGAVAVERVFAIPGIGRLMLGAANSQDLPALQGAILAIALASVTVGVLIAALRLAILGGPLPPGAVPAPPERDHSPRAARWTLGIAVGALLLMLAVGLPRDPYSSTFDRLQSPSLAIPFGADASGRDLLARVAHGAIGTLVPAVCVAALAVVVALLLGFTAAAARGPVEIANAMPPIIAGVLVAALFGPSAMGAAIAVLAVSWPPLASHAAALIEEAKAMPHVRWLPTLGTRGTEIAVRHIVPVVLPPLLRHGALRLPGIALALASLGFLGLGAQPPTPEWGLVLSEGIGYVERAPWATTAPASALVLASIIGVACASLGGARTHAKRSRSKKRNGTPVPSQLVKR